MDLGAVGGLFVGPWPSFGVRTGAGWLGWGAGTPLMLAGFTASPTPTPFPVPPTTIAIDAGVWHACALTEDGHVWCWGGPEGLGDGGSAMRTTPFDVPLPEPARRVVAGRAHTCALLASGRIACWGRDEHGEVGDGPGSVDDCSSTATVPIGCALRPVMVVGVDDAIDLATGSTTTCARRASGRVVCWGANDWGQIGDGTFVMRERPTEVVGI